MQLRSRPIPKLRVLGLIPARAGSRGVANKNIRLLCGKPLLQYTTEAAKESKRLTRVVLSTESDEIADVARSFQVEVLSRPAELARDETPMLPVVIHALTVVEADEDRSYDAVCLLQPTNPFRSATDIDACIEKFESSDADSIVTILPVPDEHNPHWVYFADPEGALRLCSGADEPISRRQDLPRAYHREGSIYVTRRRVLIEQNSLYGKHLIGYPMLPDNCVNIDTPADWQRAEQLLITRTRPCVA